jgi:hypothetical protein
MQRAEWCLDDYIITDKLYKGYASMGEHGAVDKQHSLPAMLLSCMWLLM